MIIAGTIQAVQAFKRLELLFTIGTNKKRDYQGMITSFKSILFKL